MMITHLNYGPFRASIEYYNHGWCIVFVDKKSFGCYKDQLKEKLSREVSVRFWELRNNLKQLLYDGRDYNPIIDVSPSAIETVDREIKPSCYPSEDELIERHYYGDSGEES